MKLKLLFCWAWGSGRRLHHVYVSAVRTLGDPASPPGGILMLGSAPRAHRLASPGAAASGVGSGTDREQEPHPWQEVPGRVRAFLGKILAGGLGSSRWWKRRETGSAASVPGASVASSRDQDERMEIVTVDDTSYEEDTHAVPETTAPGADADHGSEDGPLLAAEDAARPFRYAARFGRTARYNRHRRSVANDPSRTITESFDTNPRRANEDATVARIEQADDAEVVRTRLRNARIVTTNRLLSDRLAWELQHWNADRELLIEGARSKGAAKADAKAKAKPGGGLLLQLPEEQGAEGRARVPAAFGDVRAFERALRDAADTDSESDAEGGDGGPQVEDGEGRRSRMDPDGVAEEDEEVSFRVSPEEFVAAWRAYKKERKLLEPVQSRLSQLGRGTSVKQTPSASTSAPEAAEVARDELRARALAVVADADALLPLLPVTFAQEFANIAASRADRRALKNAVLREQRALMARQKTRAACELAADLAAELYRALADPQEDEGVVGLLLGKTEPRTPREALAIVRQHLDPRPAATPRVTAKELLQTPSFPGPQLLHHYPYLEEPATWHAGDLQDSGTVATAVKLGHEKVFQKLLGDAGSGAGSSASSMSQCGRRGGLSRSGHACRVSSATTTSTSSSTSSSTRPALYCAKVLRRVRASSWYMSRLSLASSRREQDRSSSYATAARELEPWVELLNGLKAIFNAEEMFFGFTAISKPHSQGGVGWVLTVPALMLPEITGQGRQGRGTTPASMVRPGIPESKLKQILNNDNRVSFVTG